MLKMIISKIGNQVHYSKNQTKKSNLKVISKIQIKKPRKIAKNHAKKIAFLPSLDTIETTHEFRIAFSPCTDWLCGTSGLHFYVKNEYLFCFYFFKPK